MTFPDSINDRDWVQQTRALFAKSRAQSGYNRYTQPSPGAVALQSPFNSALHAIVYRWFDAEMANDELKSATAKQVQDGDEAGMIPGSIDWRGEAPAEAVTAPPLLAFATVQVYHFSGDTNLLERVYPRLAAWHEWFDRRRDDDGDGLVSIDHPAEFIVAGGGINVNAMRAADLDALAHIAEDMGDTTGAARWHERGEAVRAALLSQPTGIYERINATLLTILFGRGVTLDDAAALVERAWTQTPENKLFPWLVESDNPISMIDNWLIYLGLRRYGFNARASWVAEKSFRLIEQSGFWQFYDSSSGVGMGLEDYPAAALALDMLFREKSGRAPKPQCVQDVD